MSNEDFLAKAPAEVVPKEKAKLQARPKNSPNSKPTGNGSGTDGMRNILGEDRGNNPPALPEPSPNPRIR